MTKDRPTQRSRRRAAAATAALGLALSAAAATASAAAAAPPGHSQTTTTLVPATTIPLDNVTRHLVHQHTLGPKFLAAREQLEGALAARVQQLAKLTTQVNTGNLQPAHKNVLSANLGTETALIGGLADRVPHDTTWAQLDSARRVMLGDNRVFAVMTPQVYETIEADSIAAEVSTMQSQQLPELQGELNSLAPGDPGYKNATSHFQNYVHQLQLAATASADVADRVLAQQPQYWPRDEQVFVKANQALLRADIAVAHANYDASVIGLATGGYSGS